MTTIFDEQASPAAATSVAERLRQAIDESGMTQIELATRIAGDGATDTRIRSTRRLLNKWLAGTKPGRRYALRLATIFDCAPDYFLEETAAAHEHVEAITEEIEFDDLAYAAAKKARIEIPPTFDAHFVAEQLALNFREENILVDEVDQWRALEFATGLAHLDENSLRLGAWYTDSSLVPGIVITELLCQAASIALLTDPVYRKRVVLVGRIDQLRIRRIVEYGTKLRFGAKLLPDGLHHAGRIAQYETWARLADEDGETGELVARATVILSTR